MGLGESAIQSLLSTNPDPDHVTHAHAGERPIEGADGGNSPSPSIDSDKENNVEMVNLLHPNTPGKTSSSQHVFKQDASEDVAVDVQREEDQEEEELLGDVQKPAKVVMRLAVLLCSADLCSLHLLQLVQLVCWTLVCWTLVLGP